MSAWKWMSPAARKEAVATYIEDGLDAPAIARVLGATVDQVLRSAGKYADNLVHGKKDTDEGQPRPPESPACDGTPTPATAEHAPGDGGPDGGSSTVAGATSDGGGEGVASAAAVTAAAPATAQARTSPPPQIRRQKVTRPEKVAGERKREAEPLPPEPKSIPEPNEVSVTVHIDRRIMDVVQTRAKKAAWTRAQMIAAIVTQACSKG